MNKIKIKLIDLPAFKVYEIAPNIEPIIYKKIFPLVTTAANLSGALYKIE